MNTIIHAFEHNANYSYRMNTQDEGAEHFGIWLQRQLRNRGWSQAYLAERLGKDRGVIGNWVRGDRVPSPSSCDHIADVLGFRPATVLMVAGHLPPDIDIDPESDKARILEKMERVTLIEESRVALIEHMLNLWLDADRKQVEEFNRRIAEADREQRERWLEMMGKSRAETVGDVLAAQPSATQAALDVLNAPIPADEGEDDAEAERMAYIRDLASSPDDERKST